MIGFPTTLNYSSNQFQYFVINNSKVTGSLYPVIKAPRYRQRIICDCFELAGYKADYFIIRDTNFLPPGLLINNNK